MKDPLNIEKLCNLKISEDELVILYFNILKYKYIYL